MKQRLKYLVPVALAALLAIPACTTTNPNEPSVTFTAPVASGPAGATTFKFKAQPVTLNITNAVRTGSAAATYNLEVATDAGFAAKVVNQTGISEGTSGTTSVTLPTLNGGATYYWRYRAVVDGVAGQPTSTQSFNVLPQIVINAPTPVSPASGSSSGDPRPKFTVTNSIRTGPVGTIFYLFQVSTSQTFATISASANVQETATTTSWTPTSDLAVGQYYWRVQASDPTNSETTAFTNTQQVQRKITELDMSIATIVNSPGDLASWTPQATITHADTTQYVIVDHDAREGPGAWPDVQFGPGSLQYTLGMCLFIQNHWYCSAVVQFWRGRELEAGGVADEVNFNWFYGRWGIMNGYQPQQGETVGLFAAAGNNRDNAGGVLVKERTKVLLVPWGTVYDAPIK